MYNNNIKIFNIIILRYTIKIGDYELTNKLRTYEPNLNKCGFIVILIYIIVTVGFYFLAGEQLHFRQSRGNIDILQAEYGTIEMTSESVVEQFFTPKIQRLKSCSVQWGT